MRAISLFTGAGGLDLGCEAAGFETAAAVESNRQAQLTLLANQAAFFPTLSERAIFGDITCLSTIDLLRAADALPGEIDLVHGGPPCTPFSKSGYWLEYKRLGEDPKASLLGHYVRIVAGVRPKAFLMENVYGLAYRNHNQAVFQQFREDMRLLGYSFDHRVVLAADYGVPQLRQRLICIGIREDLLPASPDLHHFDWPEPSHAGRHETRRLWDTGLPPHRTAGEALEGLNDLTNQPEPGEAVSGTFADAFEAVPPGDNYLWWTEERGHPAPRFKWRSRYWNFLLKLHPDRPSPTIQGQPGPWVGPFHWDNRRLRVAEVKRLMTFPDEFKILGSRREQQLQLGNAVPPLLAEKLASSIADALTGEATQLVGQLALAG